MTHDDLPDRESESQRDQGTWTRLLGWSKEHRRPLLLFGFGVTAAALGARGRGAGSTGSVMEVRDGCREGCC